MDDPFDLFDDWDEDYGPEYESDQLSDDPDPPPTRTPYIPSTRPRDPIQLQRTAGLRKGLQGQNISQKVENILRFMDSQGMDLPIFLDALSWGDPGCVTNPKCLFERTGLMVSDKLPHILARWYKPPRSQDTHDARANGGRRPLQEFAVSCVGELINSELERSQDLMSPPLDGLSETALISFSLEEQIRTLREPAGVPVLWNILQAILVRPDRRSEGPPARKDPDKVAYMIISQIAYTRNRRLSQWPRLMTIYLKGVGLAAKGLDLLHALGVTMSYKWSVRAFNMISKEAMKEAAIIVRTMPFVFSHDNLNIPFTAYSQRLNNKSHFDSGTAGTIFSQPHAPRPLEAPLSNPALQCTRAEGSQTPITTNKLLELQAQGGPSLHRHTVHHVLQFLLDSPDFDFPTYIRRDSDLLLPPPAVHQLPFGPQYITQQHVMHTVHMEEASYEGNERLIHEWARQLQLSSPEEQKHTGEQRIWVWIGDQLSVDRLRGLVKNRSRDHNSFDRLDWIVPVFGWFHLQMAFANSLHKQFLGSMAGKGLLHAITNLGRKGLSSVSTKGPFHHNLDELIMHVAEARFQACICATAGVRSLSQLRSKSPEELVALADKVVRLHASMDTLDTLWLRPENDQDDVYRNSVLWNRDVLKYIELRYALKSGDVGRMENMLPHLLFRFAGGQNHKYAVEVLELLQSLHYEWPKELSDFVRRRAWVVNMKGRGDSFLPIDMAQEHNIKDIKVTYRSQGPHAGWDLLYQRGPAIPKIRIVRAHFETLFPILIRGTEHTSPRKAADVAKLAQIYTEAKVNTYIRGRKAGDKDVAADTVSNGFVYVNNTLLPKWAVRRLYPRNTTEFWSVDEAVASMTGDAQDDAVTGHVVDRRDGAEGSQSDDLYMSDEVAMDIMDERAYEMTGGVSDGETLGSGSSEVRDASEEDFEME